MKDKACDFCGQPAVIEIEPGEYWCDDCCIPCSKCSESRPMCECETYTPMTPLNKDEIENIKNAPNVPF